MMARMHPLLFAFLLSTPLVVAWIPQARKSSSLEAKTTRLFAFQTRPPAKKILRPRNDNNYEPYDWENDKLDFVDKESERPWKIDEYDRNALTIRRQEERPEEQPQQSFLLSRWNPFSSKKTSVPQPPINSRARLSTTDAGTLVIDLPATGVDSKAISSGIFGTLWFSAIVPATFAGGFAAAAFLLPFWLAGGLVAKAVVVDPFVTSQLTIGKYAWSLSSNYANTKQLRQVDGSTEDLRGATVEDMNLQVNGKSFYEIRLYGEKGVTGFGNGLEPEELEYLSYVINNHLQQVRNDEKQDDDIYGFISGSKQD